jgi:hypothetical protein
VDTDGNPVMPDSRNDSLMAYPHVVVDTGFSTTTADKEEDFSNAAVSYIGSALQRNDDGSIAVPKVIKKKQKGQKASVVHHHECLNKSTSAYRLHFKAGGFAALEVILS